MAVKAYDVVCVHPHAIGSQAYRVVAEIAGKRSNSRATALVYVANPCLAAINAAVQLSLGEGWTCINWSVA